MQNASITPDKEYGSLNTFLCHHIMESQTFKWSAFYQPSVMSTSCKKVVKLNYFSTKIFS